MAQWKKVIVSGSSAVLSGLELDTQLAVGQGGTGATTLTDGGVLLGSGTGAVTATAVLSDGQMLVGDGTTDPSLESGATLRTSIGVGTGDSPQFTAVNIGAASDTTVARASAGDINVEGNLIYRAGGTDVPVTDGGTGASSAGDARTNLGVAIGSDVQAYDAQLADVAGLAVTDSGFIVGDGSNFVLETGGTLRTSLGVGTADNVEFANAVVNNLTNNSTVAASHLTGSFTGSFVGDGNSLDLSNNTSVSQEAFKTISVTGSDDIVADSATDTLTFASSSDGLNITTDGDTDTLTFDLVAIPNSSLEYSTISGISLGSNLNSLSITANGGIGMTSYNGSAGVSDLALDIDGMTDIGAGLADADLFIVDDGAVGTNRKTVASRIPTYLNDHANLTSLTSLTAVGTITDGVWNGASIADDNVVNALTISNGTVNGSVIGGSTPAAGTFTTLTVNNDLTVTGNLDVNGTVTTIDSTNLYVADKFALFASGSTAATDGGIVVQNSAAGTGYALGYDVGKSKWAFQNNLAHDASDIAPDAYVGVIETGTGAGDSQSAPVYGGATNGVGTIYVDTDDSEIWIYA